VTRGRDAAHEPEPVPGVWQPPPEEERQDSQVYDNPLSDPDDILRIRLTFDLHDNLVDFAVMIMTGPPGAELEIARADIRHTGLHVHWFYQDGSELRREEIRPVTKQAEVQGAYNEALDVLTERCAEYKRRWHRG
jgi:hypothetical protein